MIKMILKQLWDGLVFATRGVRWSFGKGHGGWLVVSMSVGVGGILLFLTGPTGPQDLWDAAKVKNERQDELDAMMGEVK